MNESTFETVAETIKKDRTQTDPKQPHMQSGDGWVKLITTPTSFMDP